MSDTISKAKLLERLEQKRQEYAEEYEVYREGAICDVIEEIQSGAFDADESEGTWKATAEVLGRENAQMNSEIQRLRAALVEIKQLLNENRENDGAFQSWNHMQAWKVATQALSTTTEPKQDKTCVICGTREGKYLSTANRWFCEPCTDALPPVNVNAAKVERFECPCCGCEINAREKVGTEEWRHKYFGAEWPKAEGDGNDA